MAKSRKRKMKPIEALAPSSDTQGLPSTATVANESIGGLAGDNQSLDASFLDGVADAANHPEQPVRTHERKGTAA